MASDLFDDPVQQQLVETRKRFMARIEEGAQLRRSKQARRGLYARWRKEFGDDIARESAKYVEALLAGKVGWPKFAK
jgi:hypothetical protein